MDNRGFIKLHRKLLTWEWYHDTNAKLIFLHLLLSANWEDKRWRGVVIRRGQLVSSIGELSKELKLTLQQARTAIKKLMSTNEITCQATNKFTLYTIVNYSSYQDNKKENNKQNNIQITNEQQTSISELNRNETIINSELTSKTTNKKTLECLDTTDSYKNEKTANNKLNNRQTTNEQQSNNKRVTTTKEVKEVKKLPPIVPHPRTSMGTNGDEREIDLLSASFSPTYQAVLDCWRDERVKTGFATGLIGKNSKTGALKLATAIDSGETTLANAKLAIQNLLADTEKRENYSLDGLVNNFEIWVNRSPPEVKTIQLNQTKEVAFYSGVCKGCSYSTMGIGEGVITCPRCEGKIELREEA